MKYLIDTHILIWYGAGTKYLKPNTVALLRNPDNEIFVSHASIWEMAIKASIGKLQLGFPISQLEEKLSQLGFKLLPFDFRHYEALSNLPFFHNDPFDRMIIAQAMIENVEIVTHDAHFSGYPVRVVKA